MKLGREVNLKRPAIGLHRDFLLDYIVLRIRAKHYKFKIQDIITPLVNVSSKRFLKDVIRHIIPDVGDIFIWPELYSDAGIPMIFEG